MTSETLNNRSEKHPDANHVVAPVQEVFSSVQGEGPYVGRRQVFVRFAHCHLKCDYCDTSMTTEDGRFYAEIAPGSTESEAFENPVDVSLLLGRISGLLGQAKHHSVSFTGGEPLLYHQFLKALMPTLQQSSQTYLETSGTQPEFLAHVLPWTDIIAMDVKLPSATGEAPLFDQHAAFLSVAESRAETEVFIKLIFGPDTTDEELKAVIETVKNRRLPVILQPVTDLADQQVHLDPAFVLSIHDRLAETFDDVRMIPQTHKMVQVR